MIANSYQMLCEARSAPGRIKISKEHKHKRTKHAQTLVQVHGLVWLPDQPLAVALSAAFHDLVKGQDPQEPLWNCTFEKWVDAVDVIKQPTRFSRHNKAFEEILVDLKLEHLHLTRYGSRHAEATHDLFHKLRPLA